MKLLSTLALLLPFTTATPLAMHKRAIPTKAGYKLTFYDDFTGPAGTSAYSGNWNVMTGTSYPGGPERWGNNEVQSYTRAYANLVVTSAKTIWLKAVKMPGNVWTSARIESKRGDFTARSGGKMFIEARIKLGNAAAVNQQGIWPAFWAMGNEYRGKYNNWPDVTEWDILEVINGQNTMHSVLHCGYSPGGPCNEFSGLGSGGVSFSRGVFHTVGFQIDRTMVGTGKTGTWKDEEISWFLDGRKIFAIKGSRINDQTIWDKIAHRGHYLIFNVAVGGNWAGPPNSLTRSHEATGMEVDYVGVWNL